MSEEVNFSVLDIKVPNVVKTYSIDKQREIFDYLNELEGIHKNGYNIAFDHLGSSFDILRSNGFKEWQKSKISK
jgi:hypothetical protein